MRKGARRQRAPGVLQFAAESLLVSMLAAALGLLLAYLALPLFAALVDGKLDDLFTAPNVGAALLLGMVAAVVPAVTALRVAPAQDADGAADCHRHRPGQPGEGHLQAN